MKKVTINVNENRIEILLSLLEENNFEWVSETDGNIEVQEWQKTEVSRRKKQIENDPSFLSSLEKLKVDLSRDI